MVTIKWMKLFKDILRGGIIIGGGLILPAYVGCGMFRDIEVFGLPQMLSKSILGIIVTWACWTCLVLGMVATEDILKRLYKRYVN